MFRIRKSASLGTGICTTPQFAPNKTRVDNIPLIYTTKWSNLCTNVWEMCENEHALVRSLMRTDPNPFSWKSVGVNPRRGIARPMSSRLLPLWVSSWRCAAHCSCELTWPNWRLLIDVCATSKICAAFRRDMSLCSCKNLTAASMRRDLVSLFGF
jgi:hypothetical protein